MTWVIEGEYQVFTDSANYRNMRTLVACFRNEVEYGQAGVDAVCVTAHLSYRNARGDEIGEGISKACWLDEMGDNIDIPVAMTRCVMLIMAQPHRSFTIHRLRTRSSLGDGIDTRVVEFDQPVAQIELKLLDERNRQLLPTVKFRYTDDGTTLAAQVIP